MDNVRHNGSLPGIASYCSSIGDLIECLRRIHHKWEECASALDSLPTHETVQRSHPDGPGRPDFEIGKDQLLEYQASLSFKWTEIAALLGVSRIHVRLGGL